MNAGELYGEGYFLRGEGSNYNNYTWQGEPTLNLARSLVDLLGIRPPETIMDIGCARGYVVRALREIGFDAYGYDISTWAIENCDESVRDYVGLGFPSEPHDYFFAKDVFEHVPVSELSHIIARLLPLVRSKLLIVVPLSAESGGPYLRKEDNLDATHLIRWPLESWLAYVQSLVSSDNFIVSGSWHWPRIKPSSATHLKSCGFILVKRI